MATSRCVRANSQWSSPTRRARCTSTPCESTWRASCPQAHAWGRRDMQLKGGSTRAPNPALHVFVSGIRVSAADRHSVLGSLRGCNSFTSTFHPGIRSKYVLATSSTKELHEWQNTLLKAAGHVSPRAADAKGKGFPTLDPARATVIEQMHSAGAISGEERTEARPRHTHTRTVCKRAHTCATHHTTALRVTFSFSTRGEKVARAGCPHCSVEPHWSRRTPHTPHPAPLCYATTALA